MSTGALAARLTANWQLKASLTLGMPAAFLACYLSLQRYPLFPATPVRELWLDRIIPFWPNTIYLYESMWLLMPIAPWLMRSREQLIRYCRSIAAVSAVGFCVFFFFPTAAPRPELPANVNFLYSVQVGIDRELNAFPSLHVALAMLIACWFRQLARAQQWPAVWSWLFWGWAVSVSISTMFTKQHYFLDVAAGAILGFAGYALFRRPGKGTTHE